jgi:hypothetical protein
MGRLRSCAVFGPTVTNLDARSIDHQPTIGRGRLLNMNRVPSHVAIHEPPPTMGFFQMAMRDRAGVRRHPASIIPQR